MNDNENVFVENLEKLIQEENIIKYDPICVRKKSNISKSHNEYKFDSPDFSPKKLLNDIPNVSPKLDYLVKNIEKLDKEDLKKHGKRFKHFVFSDLKSSSAGSKLLASALVASGMKMAYHKPGSKLELLSDVELLKSKNNNLYLLSSTGVYEKPISVTNKKEMLKKFNQRPENIHGELARIIVMDSGFKEGIDLFDIKYIHLFEPSILESDQKQVIGRGTRTCGQKGLEFIPNRGWPLHVYVYDLEIPEKVQSSFLDSKNAIELYLKATNLDVRLFHFSHDLEETSILGSVDYDLNKNIHSFSISGDDSVNEQHGGSKRLIELNKKDSTVIVPTDKFSITLPNGILVGNPPEEQLGYKEMKKYIQDEFSHYEWGKVKMENLCKDDKKGGAGQVITYTPTQDFIRHYFTPENPLKGMLLWNSVGTGKCHAENTPILMFDGSIKMVQDIKEGDVLMGDDSTPRAVLSLAQGIDELYDIIPVKGEKYTVNSEHILCLKPTRLGVKNSINANGSISYIAPYINKENGKVKTKTFKSKEEANLFLDEICNKDYILEIPVNEYLKLSKSSKKDINGYRVGVNFPTKEVDFDPYIIGFWLGDGSKRDPVISTQDSKIIKYLMEELPKHNLILNYQSNYDYRISSSIKKGENKLLKSLQKYNLINNKHIPNEYKINNKQIRFQILAGLIDSDGYGNNSCYEIIQKNKILANDIVFLCRSLGFAAYMKECEKSCMYKGEKKTGTYYRISISGDELIDIPVKIDRKRLFPRLQKKNVLVSGIEVKNIGKGNYYGFTLDGNNRYLLGDFTVTHNTCSAIATATSSFEQEGYTILWVTRTTLKSDIWKNMFDQVCNQDIRDKLINNAITISDDTKKNMKLLSKSWRIRPMSYKQFSNLVSKQNAFYKTLVKINGEIDPLRKTLLIIDEAHKLYGGTDLSSLERPDMNAFHQALMNSYQISGKDSVKLLLMTATPITQSPMELIQLLNLCKRPEQQLPNEFDEFREHFLDEDGKFTENGKNDYLDKIAGHISYLNREKDARQFAQPIIHKISVPILKDVSAIDKFDKKYIRNFLESDVLNLKKEIEENTEKLENDIDELDPNRLNYLKDKCKNLENDKEKKGCEKIVRENIRLLSNETKVEIDRIKQQIKDVREQIKNKNLFKNEQMANIKENMGKYKKEYDDFTQSAYYNIRNQCGKTAKTRSDLRTQILEHPKVIQYDEKIKNLNIRINELQNNLKHGDENSKKRIKQIRELSKDNLNQLEKDVIKMVIRDENKTKRNLMKTKNKETSKLIEKLKKKIKKTQKRREKTYKTIRKTLKQVIDKEKREEKKIKKAEREEKKILRGQEHYIEHVNNELMKNLGEKYSNKIDNELVAFNEKGKLIQEEKMKKENEKKEKKEQLVVKKQKEREEKKETKEKERATKKILKEKERQEKKEAKKNKTMKNKK